MKITDASSALNLLKTETTASRLVILLLTTQWLQWLCESDVMTLMSNHQTPNLKTVMGIEPKTLINYWL